jgi:hypothetical protein
MAGGENSLNRRGTSVGGLVASKFQSNHKFPTKIKPQIPIPAGAE